MGDIKFGTDGWRAIIGDQYTVGNVRRVSEGVSLYMKNKGLNKVVIGHDTRFGGQMFCQAAGEVFASYGLEVVTSPHFVTTPMISLAVRKLNADLGVVITASHNPPAYNGYKIKESFGGPAGDNVLRAIESLIPSEPYMPDIPFSEALEKGIIVYYDMEFLYLETVKQHFSLDKLKPIAKGMAYDSMFGAGSRILKRLFKEATHLHDAANPGFMGTPPEPIQQNLGELAACIRDSKDILFGLANDGDADRIGLLDEEGSFIDAHHIMLLTLYYLVEIKGYSGKVVLSAATSEKVGLLAEQYGLDYEYTKIGFKYITPRFISEKAILGGEEAGGVAVSGHIPERDGIWAGLIVMELMANTGKTLKQLVAFMHQKVGSFVYDRLDLRLSPEQKTKIMENCAAGKYQEFAGYKIIRTSTVDGFRFFFASDTWLMIRPSGTEPVLRLYAQAADQEKLNHLLTSSKRFLLK